MSALVSRPTENEAIGNAMRHQRPRLSLTQLLLDRAAAVTRKDWHGHYLLSGRIRRVLHADEGER